MMIDRAGKLPLILGRVVATPAALEALAEAKASPLALLIRHAMGDWGVVDPEDAAANDQAVIDFERVLSAYRLSTDETVWIITEADRSVTTILLPSDY